MNKLHPYLIDEIEHIENEIQTIIHQWTEAEPDRLKDLETEIQFQEEKIKQLKKLVYPKRQEENLIEIIEEIESEIEEHESDSLNSALESVRTEIEYVGYDYFDAGVMTEENPSGMDIEQIKTDFAKIKRHLQKINKSVDRSMSFQELPPADELEKQLRHTSTMFTHLVNIDWA